MTSNLSTSILARLLTLAKQRGDDYNLLLNRFGAKDPALLVSPADLQVGKRWRSAFTNTRPGGPTARSFYEHRCTALEDIEVPAGRFKAFRVEAHGEALLQVIREQGGAARRLLLVTHNPATQNLALALSGSGDRLLRRQIIEKYPTAGLAILTLTGSSWADLSDGQCRLDGFVKPRDLASGEA